jgi:hypothetical protein
MSMTGEGLRAGATRVEITPSEPTPMAGYPIIRIHEDGPRDHVGYVGRTGLATGVHDPLYARALALGDDRGIVVLVALDLCMVTEQFTQEVREGAASRTGVDPGSILLAASHTHGGPDLFDYWEPAVPGTREETRDRVVGAIATAVTSMRPAAAGWGRGSLAEPITNRRDAAGDKDPEIGVLRVEDRDGEVIAATFIYSCHPICVGAANREFTADFPGYAAAVVERSIGPGAVALFLNGAAGNINPCAFPYAPDRDVSAMARAHNLAGQTVTFRSHDAAARLGNMLGVEVLRAAERTATSPDAKVAAHSGRVDIPLKEPQEMERFFDHLAMRETPRSRLARRRTVELELQVLTIAGGVLVGLPGEPFVEMGLAIKQAAPHRPVYAVGYANDYPGYIPSTQVYFQNRYESVATPLGAMAAERVQSAAVALLGEAIADRADPRSLG